jgi:hypothetical protein
MQQKQHGLVWHNESSMRGKACTKHIGLGLAQQVGDAPYLALLADELLPKQYGHGRGDVGAAAARDACWQHCE